MNNQPNSESHLVQKQNKYTSPKLHKLGSLEKVQAFVQGQTTESATSGVYDRTIL